MNRGAWVALVYLSTSASCMRVDASVQEDPVREYFAAKQRFNRDATSASPAQRGALIASGLKDLETRIRTIIGPVSIEGGRGEYNLLRDPYTDVSSQMLDGLAFSDSSRREIVVTTPELISGWLRDRGSASPDLFTWLARENELTWIFTGDAHVYPYVDVLKAAQLPKEVVLAQLVARGQDVVRQAPDGLIVGIRRGSRVYLVSTIAPEMTVPPECDRALDAAIKKSGRYFDEEEAVFLSCYARLGPRLPEFTRVVAQVGDLATRFH